MARECVTHHICDCNRERMDALEVALAEQQSITDQFVWFLRKEVDAHKRTITQKDQLEMALARAEVAYQRFDEWVTALGTRPTYDRMMEAMADLYVALHSEESPTA